MAQVTIRNLDESVVNALKARAAAHRRSLEQELRLVLTEAAQPSREEVRLRASKIRAMARREVAVDLDELVRTGRER